MKLSWSHKLFLLINSQIGKRRWLDLFMIFCARDLIYLMGFAYLVLGFFTEFFAPYLFAFFVLLPGYLVSLALGVILKLRRPAATLPGVRTLITTPTTWKSFPSDHTYFSFGMAVPFIILQFPIYTSALFILAACFVSSARVYVGVHFPRDIIGGLSLLLLSVPVFFFISFILF